MLLARRISAARRAGGAGLLVAALSVPAVAQQAPVPDVWQPEGFAGVQLPEPYVLTLKAKRADLPAPYELTLRAERGDLPAPHELRLRAERADLPAPYELRLRAERTDLPAPYELRLRAERADLPAPYELRLRAERVDLPAPYELRLRAERTDLPEAYALTLRARRPDLPAPYVLTLRATRPAAELVRVPEVVGLALPAARERLAEVDLQPAPVLGVPAEEREQTPGSVYASDPAEGSEVEARSEVVLNVFAPRPTRTVPDLAGLSLEEARGRLAELDFDPAGPVLGKPAPEDAEPGSVMGSQPPKGTALEIFSPVSILVYAARAPAAEQPPAAEGAAPPEEVGAWAQAWKGRVSLTRLLANGQPIGVAQAQARIEGDWRAAKASFARERAENGTPQRVITAFGQEVAEAVTEAVMGIVSAALGLLEDGVPLSFALTPEGEGYRLSAVGPPEQTAEANENLRELPLLRPLDERTLGLTYRREEGDLRVVAELIGDEALQTADLRLVVSSSLPPGESPWFSFRTLELTVAGSFEPGGIPIEQLVEALSAEFTPHLEAASARIQD